MSSVHNVTVVSPPPSPAASGQKRNPRDIREALQLANQRQQVDDVVEEPNDGGITSSHAHRDRTRTHTLGADEVLVLKTLPPKPIPVKEPIAFDIRLDEPKVVAQPAEVEDDEEDEESYEDDFDLYESDFESCSSSASASAAPDLSDDDPTTPTTTSLHIAADEELKVVVNGDADSGMYELKRQPTVTGIPADHQQSLPPVAGSDSNQPDSGFG